MSRKLQKAAFHACFSPVVKAFHDAWHEDAILRLITLIKLECIQSSKRGNRNLNKSSLVSNNSEHTATVMTGDSQVA